MELKCFQYISSSHVLQFSQSDFSSIVAQTTESQPKKMKINNQKKKKNGEKEESFTHYPEAGLKEWKVKHPFFFDSVFFR